MAKLVNFYKIYKTIKPKKIFKKFASFAILMDNIYIHNKGKVSKFL